VANTPNKGRSKAHVSDYAEKRKDYADNDNSADDINDAVHDVSFTVIEGRTTYEGMPASDDIPFAVERNGHGNRNGAD